MDTTQCLDRILEIIDLNLGGYIEMGGKGSGNWGHKGRKGKRGGSAPGGGKGSQFRAVPVGQRSFGSMPGGAFLSQPVQREVAAQPPTNSKLDRIDQKSLSHTEQAHVADAVRVLPQEHLDMVRVINQEDLGRNLGGECSVDRQITLNKHVGNTMYDSSTIVHEVGHAVMYNKGGRVSKHGKQFKTFYKEKVKGSGKPERQVAAMARGPFAKPVKGFPSGYSMFNSEELFAESYLMFVNSPSTLRQRAPDLYDYMRDNVFGGIEY